MAQRFRWAIFVWQWKAGELQAAGRRREVCSEAVARCQRLAPGELR